jgi:hypothetical protein
MADDDTATTAARSIDSPTAEPVAATVRREEPTVR